MKKGKVYSMMLSGSETEGDLHFQSQDGKAQRFYFLALPQDHM